MYIYLFLLVFYTVSSFGGDPVKNTPVQTSKNLIHDLVINEGVYDAKTEDFELTSVYVVQITLDTTLTAINQYLNSDCEKRQKQIGALYIPDFDNKEKYIAAAFTCYMRLPISDLLKKLGYTSLHQCAIRYCFNN